MGFGVRADVRAWFVCFAFLVMSVFARCVGACAVLAWCCACACLVLCWVARVLGVLCCTSCWCVLGLVCLCVLDVLGLAYARVGVAFSAGGRLGLA